MPLPVILGVVAAISATSGLGAGAHGGVKMKKANNTLSRATQLRDDAVKRFEVKNKVTTTVMDELGKLELEICAQFQEFADVLEKIQGRPEFKEYDKNGVNIPQYDPEELKKVSVGASVLLGGVGGAAFGTIGGFAAAGATTAAVMALGTASTGTAISTLSGVAATNATLAALGGGSLAAGGGGMALGSTMLGVSTAGIGILVGGIIFNVAGSALSKKADEAYMQAIKISQQVDIINQYLGDLHQFAVKYKDLLGKVKAIYEKKFAKMKSMVVDQNRTQWAEYTEEEKMLVRNTVLLVGLLYKMCKVKLVNKTDDATGMSNVNTEDIEKCMDDVNKALDDNDLNDDKEA